MPSFTATALDSLIESGNRRSMELLRNSFDTEVQERPLTVNSRVASSIDGNYSNVEMGVSSLPQIPNPARGVSLPPNTTQQRDFGLPPNPKLERGISNPTNQKQERGASLPPTPLLERNGGNIASPKLITGDSLPSETKLEKRISAPNLRLHRRNGSSATAVERRDHWTEISPALYATPEPTPLPDSPSSFSPSPYIINHKRRGPRLLKSNSEECVSVGKTINLKENGNVATALQDYGSVPLEALDFAADENNDDERGGGNDKEAGTSEQNGAMESGELDFLQDGEFEDFVDPQDSVSVKSICESEGFTGGERNLNPATPVAEFYDAWEELSSESGHQLSTPRAENELRGMRMTLLMEIEKRKQAEETLSNMKDQWRRICDILSDVGLTLPEVSTTHSNDEVSYDPLAEVRQQIFVSRFVSESIGRGLARAEAEVELEAQINSKNFDIARLCDKLRYYEAVNQEMSQRNQEIVETARQLRLKKKRMQKWIWGSVATAVTLISASLAYSYFHSATASSSPELEEPTE